MKGAAALFCAAGACAAFIHPSPPPKTPTLVIAGETLGYLSPCGCTQPMTGGIARFGSALSQLQEAGPTLLLFSGGLVKGITRQDELKSETMAQALGSWGVTASNLAVSDAALGSGQLLTLNRLQGGRMITASLIASPSNSLSAYQEADGFVIGGASSSPARLAKLLEESPVPLEEATEAIVSRAKTVGERPVLLLDGDRSTAVDLAQRYPSLALIVYRSTGSPAREVERVGSVVLATPGERGQYLVSLQLPAGQAPTYAVRKLDPAIPDDKDTLAIYRTYLNRVTQEQLWQKSPRISGPTFVGSERCGSCHHESYEVWKNSAHAHSLETLESPLRHGQDPECLRCHIVGGQYRTGFQSRSTTPELAAVGCESCHGAGADHVRDPSRFRLKKAGEDTCKSCHEALNSPNFDFDLYWAKIRHH